MPRVTIPGIKGDVMFPDSMSDQEIMSRAKEMQLEASRPLLDPEELPTSELLKMNPRANPSLVPSFIRAPSLTMNTNISWSEA